LVRTVFRRLGTRQALQQAAMKRFVADGVHQTSVADIAADVGVTERTFYRHFPSKHAVIFADYDIGFEWFAPARWRYARTGIDHPVGTKGHGRRPI
jgi:AcrR family transcriptional regulator